MEFNTFEARYLHSCKKHNVLPNSAVISWFSKAKIQEFQNKQFCLMISLDKLKDSDVFPMVDALMGSESYNLGAIDIVHESHSDLSEQYLLVLVHAINFKLQVVDLQNLSSRSNFLRDLFQGGLDCKVLKLRCQHIQKLNMAGRFTRLHTLNLDFCTTLSSLQSNCFSCMPNLLRLSMCETKISNLWTTSAALSKLTSLVELRFQKCLCCNDTGPCLSSSNQTTNLHIQWNHLTHCYYKEEETPSMDTREDATFQASNTMVDPISNNEVELSRCLQTIGLSELSTVIPYLVRHEGLQDEIQKKDESFMSMCKQQLKNVIIKSAKNISCHPSPICFEKHYREYMISSLPHLEVLDNLSIKITDKAIAKNVCLQYYESLPYNRGPIESIVNILHKREMGAPSKHYQNSTQPKKSYSCHTSKCSYLRSLCAAKFWSSSWPVLNPLSNFSVKFKEESKRLRPRQFEYHPSDPSILAFGTLDGEIYIINHENGNTIGYIPSIGAMSSVLGLCWLKKYPSKGIGNFFNAKKYIACKMPLLSLGLDCGLSKESFLKLLKLLIAGSDNGNLKLFDINQIQQTSHKESPSSSDNVIFDSFEQLTSLHVNSTDDHFLVSGYSKDVVLYDIESGRRFQVFSNIHREPINVAKFTYHSPFLFATSSFDRDVKLWDVRQNPMRPCYTTSSLRGNVMVSFSPDDLYLLVSAVDNEVKQLTAADGRLHMKFEIANTGSSHNYTRSYYMNGRDYVISGSCDEHVVRIYCTQTGKRLRDIYLEDRESGNPMSVQSLRADPFRHFNMSILATMYPTSKCEIIKVNLLASSDNNNEEYSRPASQILGG